MNSLSQKIDPTQVAAKLAALRNLRAPNFGAAVEREPRLLELAWFMEWTSRQPGGLDKWTTQFAAEFADRLGTNAMHRIGKTEEAYTAEERNAVIADFPQENLYIDHSRAEAASMPITTEFVKTIIGRGHVMSDVTRPNLAFVSRQNHAEFLDYCRRYAMAELPWILTDFCLTPDACLPDPFWFCDLASALIEAMDAHAARAGLGRADTAVARSVTDALEFAWAEKAMVEIVGDSRYGKSQSVQTYCAAYPGRARLVKTPCTNDQRSFFTAIAEAVGVEVTLKTTGAELRHALEFIFRHSGLMLVFDESHFLIPQNFTAKTAPFRLDYVRSQILDNGCPVALVATPQQLPTAPKSFERVTGFNMAQWRGRIMRSVQLPSELPQSDLMAIVKHHFPSLKEAYAKRIVSAALISDKFIFTIESIAKNARAVARKNGHEQIDLEDLEAGIVHAGINLPKPAIAAPAPVLKPAPARVESPRQADETPRRAATAVQLLPAPARSPQPAETVNDL
jgi:hypothetical protein